MHPDPLTPGAVAQLEAEWRRLERDRLPGRLRAYTRWQKAEEQLREARRAGTDTKEQPMTHTEPSTVAAQVGKVGRLTRDPELRFAKSGTAVASFGLAVKPWAGKEQPEPETVFYEVVTFGGLAEHVSECLAKGDRVVVTGKGEVERWTGKDGVERTTKKIVADAVGPDLRFAGVDVHRTERSEPAAQQTFADEEPF